MNDEGEPASREATTEWQDDPGLRARVAQLEAENAALRRTLARSEINAERATDRHADELAGERAGRAIDAVKARTAAADAEARFGREMAASHVDLAASQADNDALRRSNVALTESRSALREHEERLKLILNSAADYAIFTTDLARRITSWNAGAERVLGWTEKEVIGRSADIIFTPEDRAAGVPDREAATALAEGRAENERWHLRKDGSRFWASGQSMPLRSPAGGPMRRRSGSWRSCETTRSGSRRRSDGRC